MLVLGTPAEIMAAQKKVMVLEALKQKLRSMAYTLKGSSPIDLFNKYAKFSEACIFNKLYVLTMSLMSTRKYRLQQYSFSMHCDLPYAGD